MVHNKKETARAYNVVAKIICTILPISCSQKSNAKWSIQDFFYGITAMCTANTYSESAMKGLTIQSDGPNPCGRWIRNAIQSITEQQMLLGLSDGIDSTVSHLKKLGMFRKPVTVAIDPNIKQNQRIKKAHESHGLISASCLWSESSNIMQNLFLFPIFYDTLLAECEDSKIFCSSEHLLQIQHTDP